MSATLVGWTEPFAILISDDTQKLTLADMIRDGNEDRVWHRRVLGTVFEVESWVSTTGRDGPCEAESRGTVSIISKLSGRMVEAVNNGG